MARDTLTCTSCGNTYLKNNLFFPFYKGNTRIIVSKCLPNNCYKEYSKEKNANTQKNKRIQELKDSHKNTRFGSIMRLFHNNSKLVEELKSNE